MEFPTEAQFRDWLDNFDKTTIVGFARSPGSCPLAVCLNDLFHVNGTAYVRPDKRWADSCWRISEDGSERQPLPKWANSFAQKVDRTHKALAGEPVFADEALTILNQIHSTSD